MALLEEPAADAARARPRRAHEARPQLALLGVVALSVGMVALARHLSPGAPAGILGGVSIALVALSALGVLGLPAALRRNRRRRAGIAEVDAMSGEEFEHRLASLYEDLGEEVRHTGRRGDFGADLVTERAGVRTVVQAKRYEGAVGIEAVQQVIGARRYYEAERARVVTNSVLTPAALALAQADDVEVVQRDDLVALLASHRDRDAGGVSWALCRQVLDGACLLGYALWRLCRLALQVLCGTLRVLRRGVLVTVRGGRRGR